ncbi:MULTISPECIES: molybdopterin molybdotransferase MoeA [unclassified Amycolatopsis]|uniref:molybdopterin molybdotransferase MoeA n=1 Tax=unclassified Amycolatopsis TaxID=2618356 RepID=UPI002E0F8F4F|nr:MULTISPECIES: gephyrin-like molybdotransferase Glp [unclassified Amycolatopsis]WSJ74435.1 molybdopterin molybdotransferase MoeA [Amycolatopsis sp. NBC_01307]WSK81917.1 molybdopterin molybdotransferase MoeA [Amycolatopsis sp. NBC_01286]
MISVDDYRERITALLGTAPATVLPLADAAGLVLAEDVPARVSLPPFDNSAMDGYAVRAADVTSVPVTLPVADDIPAGRVDVGTLEPGTAHRIMTGAPLPPGADAVVMVEDTDGGTETVTITAEAREGAHIRRLGEDVVAGSLALAAGTVLGHSHLGLAAAVGLAEVRVHRPPRVLVASTGTELVDAPAPLRHGQIYESNSVMLAAAIRELGCEVEVVRSVVDDVEEFRKVIEPRLADADLLVTSGGVSAGAYEVVKDALTGQGVEFQKVAMQPGGPQGNGRWHGVPVVTLPGNPVSVLVSFEAFLRPALLAALGHTDVFRRRVRARLTEAMSSPPGRRQYRRGVFTLSEREVTGVVGPHGGPGSHLLAAFTQANCLIVLPEDVSSAAVGDEVDVLLL